MKSEDAKVGMKVIVTSDSPYWGRHPDATGFAGKDVVKKGDILIIKSIRNNCLIYTCPNIGLDQDFPFNEVEPMKWYTELTILKFGEALQELAEKNGFKIHDMARLRINSVAILENYEGRIEFPTEFNGWENRYTKISLDESIKILSIPKIKPITAGGKVVEIKKEGIVVAGINIDKNALTRIYNMWKSGPIFRDYTVECLKDKTGMKYSSLVIGCTSASAEEVEKIWEAFQKVQ